MNPQTLKKVSTGLVFVLLLLQAVIFSETAHSLAVIFRGAKNVRASDPLPGFVWWYVAVACSFLLLAVAYLLNTARIRQWFLVLAALSLVYGVWGYKQTSSILLSWSGVFRGDIVALETASTVVFCALGIAGILDWKVRRP